jgi:hypothetical protein
MLRSADIKVLKQTDCLQSTLDALSFWLWRLYQSVKNYEPTSDAMLPWEQVLC